MTQRIRRCESNGTENASHFSAARIVALPWASILLYDLATGTHQKDVPIINLTRSYVTQQLQPSLSMSGSTLTATTRNRDFAHGGLIVTLLDQTLGTLVFVPWASGCATA